jgi:hypothetical protein
MAENPQRVKIMKNPAVFGACWYEREDTADETAGLSLCQVPPFIAKTIITTPLVAP